MKTDNIVKKTLVWFLLLSFIKLIGYYSHELFVPSAYKFEEREESKVITRDTTYNFKGHQHILIENK